MWNLKNVTQLLHGATDNQSSVLTVLIAYIAQYLSSGALKINCHQYCDPFKNINVRFHTRIYIFLCIYS